MRIREIVLRDFRSFRGERRVSFVSPTANLVHPLTVLGGSNGSGKTTILEAIEALLGFWVRPANPQPLIQEFQSGGALGITLEFAPQDLPHLTEQELRIWALVLAGYTDEEIAKQLKLRSGLGLNLVTNIAAQIDAATTLSSDPIRTQPIIIQMSFDSRHVYRRGTYLAEQTTPSLAVLENLTDQERRVLDLLADGLTNKQLAEQLFLAEGTVRNYLSNIFSKIKVKNRTEAVAIALNYRYATQAEHKAKSSPSFYGGLLYFPYERRLSVTRGGVIEPPIEETSWIFRFATSDQWKGSLEHLWVWQNYLDLEAYKEAGAEDRANLRPYVESVERVLGPDRQITISKGRVRVPVHWQEEGERPLVRLDQLPSGEQQVLLLFGELARRRRPGAVIMIDEIENSLHPTLQRLVLGNLERLAREWDAQVIVTTHSAEVINWVRGSAFINLDYPEDRFDLPVSHETETE